jgi:predicted GTPase
MAKRRVIIIGAAGRDFHNFNTFFRDNDLYDVVAFTGTQIFDIAGRKYPPELAGKLYPNGIPVYEEKDLPKLIKDLKADVCVFSYSDVSYTHVMRVGAIVEAAGASFMLLGPNDTQVKSTKPVISVCAVRTGAGKSQTSRRVIELLMAKGLKVVAARHPMPYGDLNAQKVMRFAELSDLVKNKCTIEEMEEYEPRNVIYSGVDYEAILRAAENDPRGCDVVLWDGGNNDFSFFKADLGITVVDPHRPGNEISYYPGEISLRMADVVVINKEDSADYAGIVTVRKNVQDVNPKAIVVDAASTLDVDDPSLIKGKRVLVVEDGPTLTHGNMRIGAGVIAAEKFGAAELVDPRPYVVGRIQESYDMYPDIGTLLPAQGYGEQMIRDLEATINNTPCDAVVIGTPIDLGRFIKMNKPYTRVYYNLQEIGRPNLVGVIDDFVKKHKLA